MIQFEHLKITLLDYKSDMTDCWSKELKEYEDFQGDSFLPNVEVINEGIIEYLVENNNHLIGIVSPANSFGRMDGGYDGAIREYFEQDYDIDIIPYVQDHLKTHFWGEQPVGTCTTVKIPVVGSYILHTPTMIAPSKIVDPRVVYHCTRACIIEALNKEIDHIVIPAFGGACGKVPFETVAKYMIAAIETFSHVPRCSTWHQIYHDHILSDLKLM